MFVWGKLLEAITPERGQQARQTVVAIAVLCRCTPITSRLCFVKALNLKIGDRVGHLLKVRIERFV
jgi:hypothetical protein